MSVLNQMLRDLEQRRGQSAGHGNPAIGDLREPLADPPAGTPRRLILLLSALVIGLLAALLWLLIAGRDADPSPARTMAAASPPEQQTTVTGKMDASQAPDVTSAPIPIVQPLPKERPSTSQIADSTPRTAGPAATTETETSQGESPSIQPLVAQAPLQESANHAIAETRQTSAEPERSNRVTPVDEQATQPAAPAPAPAPSQQPSSTAGVRPSEPADPMNAALAHWHAGRLQQADQALATLLQQQPDNHEVRQQRAMLLLQRRQHRTAIALLDEGLARDPTALQLRTLLARSHQSLEEHDTAIAVLESAPALDQPNARLLLAALYQQQGRMQPALEQYQATLLLDDTLGRAWSGLAISLEALNQPDQARQAWQRAMASADLPGNLRRYARERLTQLEPNP